MRTHSDHDWVLISPLPLGKIRGRAEGLLVPPQVLIAMHGGLSSLPLEEAVLVGAELHFPTVELFSADSSCTTMRTISAGCCMVPFGKGSKCTCVHSRRYSGCQKTHSQRRGATWQHNDGSWLLTWEERDEKKGPHPGVDVGRHPCPLPLLWSLFPAEPTLCSQAGKLCPRGQWRTQQLKAGYREGEGR